MQIYQHVLNTYSSAQKANKGVELPPSIDKIVGILQDVPDKFVLPVVELIVACEHEPRLMESVNKLLRERGLTGKPVAKGSSKEKSGASEDTAE